MRITPDTGILVRMNVKATGPARSLLENILAGPHELVLSEFLLDETARVLRYPRMHKLYKLTSEDIAEHIHLLRARTRCSRADFEFQIQDSSGCISNSRFDRQAGGAKKL